LGTAEVQRGLERRPPAQPIVACRTRICADNSDVSVTNASRPARIFVASTTVPRPDETAGDRRFVALLELLARSHRVDFCSVAADRIAPDAFERARLALSRTAVTLLAPGWRSFTTALVWRRYDIGLFEFFWQAEQLVQPFRAKQPHASIVVDSVDVHYER